MTDEKNERRNPRTTTVTQTGPQTDMDMDVLTPMEEHVVRMRHGLGEGDDYELKFGLGASEETLLKLANLEQFLVDKFAHTAEISGVFDEVQVEVEATSQSRKPHQRRDD